MKCINSEDIYTYDEKFGKFIYKEPYNENDYIFLVQYFDEYNDNAISLFLDFDLSYLNHVLFCHHNILVYLINKKNLNIIQVI